MEKLYTKDDCQFFKKGVSSLGFVPTMGNLHAGHLSLLKTALENNEASVISIYVNPTQFAKDEDFDKYPRTLTEDLDKIEKLQKEFPLKKIGVFLPSTETMYPSGEEITFSLKELGSILEGKLRPTHFDGVTTIVQKLFSFVEPTSSYFGLKDYQQYIIVKKMTEKLGLGIQIIGMPIVRDEEGLALSSRNRYLSPAERKDALILPQTLLKIENFLKEKKYSCAQEYIAESLGQDPHWNYLEIRDINLIKLAEKDSRDIVVLGNYQLGKTKLLDNRIIKIYEL